MKAFLLVLILVPSLLANTLFASERTNTIISNDAMMVLDQVQEEASILKSNKADLLQIEKNLKKTRKGQNIYLQFKQIGGSILIVGLVIGSYKAYFPPGFRAMLGAYVTVEGLSHGLVRLNDKDVKKILDDITKLNIVIKSQEKQIAAKVNYYCKQEPRHMICYN